LSENAKNPIDYRQHAADVRKQIATSAYPRDLTKSGSSISGFSSLVSFVRESHVGIREQGDYRVVSCILQRTQCDVNQMEYV